MLNKLKNVLVVVMVTAALSVGVGCASHGDHPHKDHPDKDHSDKDHPEK